MYKNVLCKQKLILTILNSDTFWVENSHLKLISKNQIDSLNSKFLKTKIPESWNI